MTSFVRAFLLICLLFSIFLIIALSIITNSYIEQKKLNQHFNTQLIFTALTIQNLISGNITQIGYTATQENIAQNFLKAINKNYCINNDTEKCINKITTHFKNFRYQAWNKQDDLILNYNTLPQSPLSHEKLGFNDQIINGTLWRNLVTRDPSTGITVAISESYYIRQHLINRLNWYSLVIVIVAFTFLGLLIWIIIGRGLSTIRQIEKEISNRKMSNLQPVNTHNIPTEMKPLVNAINELFIRLQSTFQREKNFASNAAHELKTPLAAIMAQAQVALNANSIEDTKEALGKILKGIDRSNHVVQQLLSLSKAIPEIMLEDTKPIYLKTEAIQVISELTPAAEKKQIDIELITPEKPVYIISNSIIINILMKNIIDNAIRYTPPKGKVKVIIETEPQHIIFSVTDTGPGIPESLKDRIFDRFFRGLEPSNILGSGLGLSIVQQIVQIHKAKINLITPKSGIGLEVRVIFKAPL